MRRAFKKKKLKPFRPNQPKENLKPSSRMAVNKIPKIYLIRKKPDPHGGKYKNCVSKSDKKSS
jgi:hypothetical protein